MKKKQQKRYEYGKMNDSTTNMIISDFVTSFYLSSLQIQPLITYWQMTSFLEENMKTFVQPEK